MSGVWTREEVEATVADYLDMLTRELANQSYNKTAHRRALQRKLDNRPEGAIERKHQNISAILLELGCPWIAGYKPLGNYQRLLRKVVVERVAGDALFDNVALKAVEQPATVPLLNDIDQIMVAAPSVLHAAKERFAPDRVREHGVKRDYLDREARNASLGSAGEEFVVSYERVRLIALGKAMLGEKVERVSVTKGDGLGFDVLSFEVTGRERFIEVKTTSFAKETPFFVSRGEIDFSRSFAGQFQLYRLFEFRRAPRMFTLPGAVDRNCLLDPHTYIARFS